MATKRIVRHPFWKESVLQDRLEEMYEVFRARPKATDKEVALRLARFSEACIKNAAYGYVADLEAEIKELEVNHGDK